MDGAGPSVSAVSELREVSVESAVSEGSGGPSPQALDLMAGGGENAEDAKDANASADEVVERMVIAVAAVVVVAVVVVVVVGVVEDRCGVEVAAVVVLAADS